MPDFSVDKTLCVSCGACARACLPHVIRMAEHYPLTAHEELCMRCQHCLAVCPTGAVSVLGRKPTQSLPLKDNLPAPEALDALVKGRRSVRQYKNKNVEPALLRQVLDAAAHAPTGGNARKLRVTIIDDRKDMDAFRQEVYARLEELAESGRMPGMPRRPFFMAAGQRWRRERMDPIFRHAPHCLLVSNAKDAVCVEQDPLIYLSYFELLAQTRGLGTLWCGLLYWCLQLALPEFLPRLGISEDCRLGYAMLFGYPAVSYLRTVEHGPAHVRKAIWPGR